MIKTVRGALKAIAETRNVDELNRLMDALARTLTQPDVCDFIPRAVEVQRRSLLSPTFDRGSPEPTERQEAFLDAIATLGRDPEGNAPTMAAIGRELGIGRHGTRPQLESLERKGLVRRVPIVITAGWELTPLGETARKQKQEE